MKGTMNKTWPALTATIIFVVSLGVNVTAPLVVAGETQPATLTLKNTKASSQLWGASYLKPTGLEMIKKGLYYSPDNGQTWMGRSSGSDFEGKLPQGYRRGPYAPFVDPVNGNILTAVLSMDIPGVDTKVPEPRIGGKAYYMRYRVSTDGGATYLFDKPVVQVGKTQANPFDGIYTGKNGYYIGDGSGDRIIRTQSGRIIVPAQSCVLGPDGKLANPGGGWSYTDVMMILGTWQEDNTIEWSSAKFIEGDPARSTRGLIEPTVVQMPDGRLLCVMRGSNEICYPRPITHKGPGYKWFSVSSDDGDTWTAPQPWTYDNDEPFFSPSACSHLMRHSSGRYFWIGNISPANPKGNHPRYPLVIGEVDPATLKLIKCTLLEIDTLKADEAKKQLSLSHMWVLEDRPTHDIMIVGQRRHTFDRKSGTPVTYRIGVQ
jgi:BNR repeat-like domain